MNTQEIKELMEDIAKNDPYLGRYDILAILEDMLRQREEAKNEQNFNNYVL